MANYEATKYDFDGANLTGIEGTTTGSIIPWPKTTAPTGFLLCDGAAVSRTTYADLFAITSTTYGVGDGSSTFNVPNLKGKMPQGYDVSNYALAATDGAANVTVTGAPASTQLATNELAAHQHTVNLGVISGGPVQYPQISFAQYYPSGFYTRPVTNFNNSHNHGVGTLSGNAFSPYVVVNYIIKT
jgi:microcystin-dependent protein